MTMKKNALSASVAGVLLFGFSSSVLAFDKVSNAELLKLIKQQAAQIDQLQKRLATVEAEQHPSDTKAVKSAPAAPAALAEASQAQVQAAIADTRENDMAVAAAQVAAAGVGSGGGSTKWGRGGEAGPIFSSDDGFFTFKPDGRLLIDFTGTHGSGYATRNIAGAQIDSARLGGEGTIGPLGYHVEADFAGNKVALRQTYLTYTTKINDWTTKFYVGNFLKDLGTEGGTEQARTPFMLRNAAATVGQPVNSSFGLGGQMKVFGDNWHYSLSVSGNSPASTTSGTTADSIAYLTRAHWNPIKGDEGFIHMGAWYYYENISAGVTSINNTPAIALDANANLAVSASSVADPTQDRAKGFELGGVYRNFWMMNEYSRRTIDSSVSGPVSRHGSSFAAGWLLTGETPGFSSRTGNWTSTKVNNPVTSGGYGAFELAARVDHYDYTDAPRGGLGVSYTLGLNWYLNDWSRIMLNYVRWHTDNQVGSYTGPDWGNSVGIRTQVVF
jgi:phosphate-selective porin OprO/OprP